MNQDNNTLGQVQQPGVVPQQGGVVPQQPVVQQAVQPQVVQQAQVVQQQPQVAVVQQAPAQASPVATEAPVAANSNVILCPKCGSEMKKDSRYCMKCGQLNYAHPDNESMKQYAWQSIKEGNYVSGANMNNKQPLTMGNNKSESISNSNPFKVCLITNISLHVAYIVLMLILLCLLGGSDQITVGLIIGAVIGNGISCLFSNSVQAMFIKAGQPWWGYFVPFYNIYIFFQIAYGSGWLMLLLPVPIIGEIYALLLFYNLGKKFYKSGWLTLFFPYVMIPIIGLDKKTEYSLLARSETDTSVLTADASKKTQSEKNYGRKKFIIGLLITVVVAVAVYFLWPYIVPLVEKLIDFVNNLIGSSK